MLDFSLKDINTEHPSIWSVAYVMLMAFALSSLLASVYHITTPRRAGLGQFIQTMVLGSLGAAIIVLAIGDSVGRGLGILGALAIIRFRTTLRQQRDIVFIFCSLGIGMACGMYGFNTAVIGAVSLSVLTLIFRMTPLNGLPQTRYQLRITIPLLTGTDQEQVEKVLHRHLPGIETLRKETILDTKTNKTELTYRLKNAIQSELQLINDLRLLDPAITLRCWSRNENENDT